MVPNTPRKQHCLEIAVLQLGFDYLFVGIYKELSKPPYHHYIVTFLNQEFDLYKEQVLEVGEMKHEREANVGMTSLNTKRQRIKLLKKLPIVAKLGKVTFLGCTHVIIWALDTQEGAWAKKMGLALLKKIDLAHVNDPLVKELFCSFNYDDQYAKLQG